MTQDSRTSVYDALSHRFSDAPAPQDAPPNTELLHTMAVRGSCRAFLDTPVPPEWVELLCALALSAPTKSDLQQRDIILLRSADTRAQLCALIPGQSWIAQAPMLAVFCGNNRRQRLLHDWHDVPFANDHFDAVFNAAGDAAIALGAFVTAAEALGLGCCPISAVRNEAPAVSALLGLPDHVFPFAGLAFGFPKHAPKTSMRLPLGVTCHVDRYQETNLQDAIAQYDAERAAAQPYEKQRFADKFAEDEAYAWSHDKVRQYSEPERAAFGRFIRAKGFNLD